MSGEERWRRWVMAPVALGVVLRLGFLLLAEPLELWADEGKYVYLAVAWNRFGLYLGSTHWLWPPGYPVFLALFTGWFGAAGPTAAKLFQVGLSTLVGASVVLLAQRLFSLRAAVVAGLLWAFYLPLVGFTHTLWPETLFLAATTPAIVLYSRVLGAPEESRTVRRRLLAAGALLGVAALVKEVALPLALLLAGGLLFHRGQGDLSRRLARGAVLLGATLVAVLPWILRNAEVYGRWAPAGVTLGQNVWWGVNGRYKNFDYSMLRHSRLYGAGDWVYRWLIEPPPGSTWRRSSAPNLIDRSGENVGRGLEFARRHPGYFLRSRIKRLADWVTPYSFFVRHHRLGLYRGLLARDGLRQAQALAGVGITILVLAAAVPGFLWSLRGTPDRLPFLLAIVCFLAPAVLTTSMSRYRVPAEPMLIVLASGFLTGAGRPWLVRSGATLGVLAGLLVLAALWLINLREISWGLAPIL